MIEYQHFNNASFLPPVDCPIVIKTQQGNLKARRIKFISRKENSMEYLLENGGTIIGRFDWTYP